MPSNGKPTATHIAGTAINCLLIPGGWCSPYTRISITFNPKSDLIRPKQLANASVVGVALRNGETRPYFCTPRFSIGKCKCMDGWRDVIYKAEPSVVFLTGGSRYKAAYSHQIISKARTIEIFKSLLPRLSMIVTTYLRICFCNAFQLSNN